MQFSMPEELRMLKAALRQFVDTELVPLESQLGDNAPDEMPDSFVKPIQDKIKASGFWGMLTPQEYTGGGLNTLGMVVARTEQCRSTFGRRIWGGDVSPLLYHCSDYIKEKYLLPTVRGEKTDALGMSEPNAGSDLAGMQMQFERRGNEYVINGTKIWTSQAPMCSYILLLARAKGSERHEGLTWFIVDKGTPGWEITRIIHNMGDHCSSENQFTDCVIPIENRLTLEGQAWTGAQQELTSNRLSNSAECLGMAIRSQGLAIEYSKQRITFGEPLANRQAVQFMLADSEIDMHATLWMLYQAAWKADQGEDIRHEASMIKVFATEMASRVIDRALQIHGATGYSKDLPIERFYRDIRAFRIFEGPSEVHRWLVARNLLRHGLGIR